MPEGKTVGPADGGNAGQRPGRRTTTAMEYMDLERFAEDTRHMIIFDVLTERFPGGLERRTDPPVPVGGRLREKHWRARKRGRSRF